MKILTGMILAAAAAALLSNCIHNRDAYETATPMSAVYP